LGLKPKKEKVTVKNVAMEALLEELLLFVRSCRTENVSSVDSMVANAICSSKLATQIGKLREWNAH
jgi:hypothetical protein